MRKGKGESKKEQKMRKWMDKGEDGNGCSGLMRSLQLDNNNNNLRLIAKSILLLKSQVSSRMCQWWWAWSTSWHCTGWCLTNASYGQNSWKCIQPTTGIRTPVVISNG